MLCCRVKAHADHVLDDFKPYSGPDLPPDKRLSDHKYVVSARLFLLLPTEFEPPWPRIINIKHVWYLQFRVRLPFAQKSHNSQCERGDQEAPGTGCYVHLELQALRQIQTKQSPRAECSTEKEDQLVQPLQQQEFLYNVLCKIKRNVSLSL